MYILHVLYSCIYNDSVIMYNLFPIESDVLSNVSKKSKPN